MASQKQKAYRDLVDLVTICKLTGMSKQNVNMWEKRYEDFPERIVLPNAPTIVVFSYNEILAWLVANERVTVTITPKPKEILNDKRN